jgi:transcriptional regulator with XRE-family HTH domain
MKKTTSQRKEISNERKIEKDYIYHGLGFPVILKEVGYHEIDGERYYEINFMEIKFTFLIFIMTYPKIEISGGMLKFIRQSLEITMEEMADRLKVAKSTISKWESKNHDKIELSNLQRFKIKSHIKDHLDRIMEYKIEQVLEEEKTMKKEKRPLKAIEFPSTLSLSSLFEDRVKFAR